MALVLSVIGVAVAVWTFSLQILMFMVIVDWICIKEFRMLLASSIQFSTAFSREMVLKIVEFLLEYGMFSW